MITTVLTTRQDKARGLLLGLMLGDALGAPFTGRARVSSADLAAEEAAPSSLVLTGDALLALALTDHLARLPAIDSALLAEEQAGMWKSRPLRCYPDSAMVVFSQIASGVRWESVTVTGADDSVAERITPVALIADDLEHVVQLALRAAAVTIPDEETEQAATVQASAAFLAMHSDMDCPLDPTQLTADLAAAFPSWQQNLTIVADLVDADATPDETADAFGHTVPRALVAFLLNPDDPDEAIRYAIQCGGETGTVAAMAGALAGARSGTSLMSKTLLGRLEGRKHATRLADQLIVP
ncbi:ADP-ribosylglycohydrolase family protein [Kibdelosporangium philippinense]|uniref:ADP-ribosylglycohydrolase family protein n=1 Tax=Kibdelosporangium philippinense TaxID=211113 RepID=A0ABS8ZWI2_9PSEU|nr:ADP-ribosylglycohydrolase family protein [Kibdelosporangium philippinense]MCE7010946.1 ADP-ribosylglycohydrolase family protein [Kibdelosporangium philippinense]